MDATLEAGPRSECPRGGWPRHSSSPSSTHGFRPWPQVVLAASLATWFVVTVSLAVSVGITSHRVGQLMAQGTVQARALRDAQAAIADMQRRLAGADSRGAGGDAAAMVARAMESVVTIWAGPHEGSGFAVETDRLPSGYRTAVLTNEHVIHAARPPRNDPIFIIRDGELESARLGAWDADLDLALLFVRIPIQPLPLASDRERSVRVGDTVYAVGSPYLLQGSVTSGVVSRVDPDIIQTDAAVNPGNSGGPLLDTDGRVVGIVVGKLFGAEGLGFAVPADVAWGIVRDDAVSSA